MAHTCRPGITSAVEHNLPGGVALHSDLAHRVKADAYGRGPGFLPCVFLTSNVMAISFNFRCQQQFRIKSFNESPDILEAPISDAQAELAVV